MRTLTQFFETKQEQRNIYEIPPNELSALLSQFFVSVRKADGEDYERSSLRGMMCSFDRVLRRHNYGLQISKDSELVKLGMSYPQNKLSFKRMARATHQTNLNHCWVVIYIECMRMGNLV